METIANRRGDMTESGLINKHSSRELGQALIQPSPSYHRHLATNNIMTNSIIHKTAYEWVTKYAAILATYGDISTWDTSRVTNMAQLFGYYNPYAGTNFDNYWSLSFNGNLSRWNTSLVTSMKGIFDGASAFNGDLSKWTASRVASMDSMFFYAETFNGNIST